MAAVISGTAGRPANHVEGVDERWSPYCAACVRKIDRLSCFAVPLCCIFTWLAASFPVKFCNASQDSWSRVENAEKLRCSLAVSLDGLGMGTEDGEVDLVASHGRTWQALVSGRL